MSARMYRLIDQGCQRVYRGPVRRLGDAIGATPVLRRWYEMFDIGNPRVIELRAAGVAIATTATSAASEVSLRSKYEAPGHEPVDPTRQLTWMPIGGER